MPTFFRRKRFRASNNLRELWIEAYILKNWNVMHTHANTKKSSENYKQNNRITQSAEYSTRERKIQLETCLAKERYGHFMYIKSSMST